MTSPLPLSAVFFVLAITNYALSTPKHYGYHHFPLFFKLKGPPKGRPASHRAQAGTGPNLANFLAYLQCLLPLLQRISLTSFARNYSFFHSNWIILVGAAQHGGPSFLSFPPALDHNMEPITQAGANMAPCPLGLGRGGLVQKWTWGLSQTNLSSSAFFKC